MDIKKSKGGAVMRRGYLLFELIIVVAIMASLSMYGLSRRQVGFVVQKTAAYEFQEVMQYARTLVRNKEVDKVEFRILQVKDGSYLYELLDGEKKALYTKRFDGDFGIFTSAGSRYYPLKKANYSLRRRTTTENSDRQMSLFFGDRRGKNMSFKLTVVPVTGRVHIYDQP